MANIFEAIGQIISSNTMPRRSFWGIEKIIPNGLKQLKKVVNELRIS